MTRIHSVLTHPHDPASERTLAAASLACSSAAVVVGGLLLRGMSTTVVTPPAAAALVAVSMPAHPKMLSKPGRGVAMHGWCLGRHASQQAVDAKKHDGSV